MKLKVLGLLFMMSLMAIVVPMSATSAGAVPTVWVEPQETKFWAPCQVSKTFTIDIVLFNKKDLTGVGIYAYDFKIRWYNSTYCLPGGDITKSMISLVKVEVIIPAAWGSKYFIVKNASIPVHEYSGKYWVGWHLAVTAYDTAPTLDEVQIPLLRLTFHIDNEPCWPDTWETPFDLYDGKLVDGCGVTITSVDWIDGKYTITSSKPDMRIKPKEITMNHICEDVKIEIWLSNMSKVFGFGFYLVFNSSLLKPDIQCVHLTDLLPPPYEYLFMDVGPGFVWVEVRRPSEKPGITCKEGAAVTICLHATFPKDTIPHNWTDTLYFTMAYVKSKCPLERTYWGPDLFTDTATYKWRPKREDLNLDCHVDTKDLALLAGLYGKDHAFGKLAGTALVDINDFVVVAKKVCKG